LEQKGSYEVLDLERVVWDEDPVAAVSSELDRRSSRRALIVASPSCRRASDAIDRLSHRPGVVGVFDGIVPHVDRGSVMALVRAARSLEADLLVTIGGGSAIDTAKVALLAIAAGVQDEAELGRLRIETRPDGSRAIPPTPPPPIRQIVVPTTLSGAEFSDLAGCTDDQTQVKQLFTGRQIGSAAVVLAPSITLTTPIKIWLSTGVRSLDHAVETLCSRSSNPYTDGLAVQAITGLSDSLRRCHADPDDQLARRDAQFAVWLACAGLNRVPWGASHGIGHQLGAVAKIPHGYCSCVLLPSVLAHNFSANGARQRLVAKTLGAPRRAASVLVRELIEALGLPTRLRDVGVTREQMRTIAETCLGNPFVRENPRPITSADDAMEILEAAY
jgi:alcohol dehydrogenase class IV